MRHIAICSYEPSDEPAIEEITYRTGYMGENLTGRDFFADRRLWFLIFIFYYARYEPEHFFVAVDQREDKAVGFICGTPDTYRQERQFAAKVAPRILLRAIFLTSWRYPRTFLMAMNMLPMMGSEDQGHTDQIRAEYPAHLHINLLPEAQRMGVGARLVNHFEEHLRAQGVAGVHLYTTNHNRKAVPFYKHLGYVVVSETGPVPHPRLDDLMITFAKRFD